jgi:hypothetical protein
MTLAEEMAIAGEAAVAALGLPLTDQQQVDAAHAAIRAALGTDHPDFPANLLSRIDNAMAA